MEDYGDIFNMNEEKEPDPCEISGLVERFLKIVLETQVEKDELLPIGRFRECLLTEEGGFAGYCKKIGVIQIDELTLSNLWTYRESILEMASPPDVKAEYLISATIFLCWVRDEGILNPEISEKLFSGKKDIIDMRDDDPMSLKGLI